MVIAAKINNNQKFHEKIVLGIFQKREYPRTILKLFLETMY